MAAIESERELRPAAILCNSKTDSETSPRRRTRPSSFKQGFHESELNAQRACSTKGGLMQMASIWSATFRHDAGTRRRVDMPYFIAWLLGVPLTVLVIIYLFMHA